MRKNTKITAAALATAALAVGLTACGSSSDPKQAAGDGEGRRVQGAGRRRVPDPARRHPQVRQGQPGGQGRTQAGGEGVHGLRPAEHRHRAGPGRRQLLPAQALPGRLQQEERHPHRARRQRGAGAARPLLPQGQVAEGPQVRPDRRRPQRHHQRGPRAPTARRQRPDHAQGRRRAPVPSSPTSRTARA